MSDLDGDTRDIIALHGQHPAEHHLPATEVEDAIRRRSYHWTIAGWALVGLAVIGALAAAGLNPAALNTASELLFAALAVIGTCAVGCVLLVASLVEHTQRPQRTLIRQAMARANANADVGAENGRLIDRNRLVTGQLAYDIAAMRKEVVAQVARLEKRIADMPDYATGVEHGLKLRRDMFGGVEGFDGQG